MYKKELVALAPHSSSDSQQDERLITQQVVRLEVAKGTDGPHLLATLTARGLCTTCWQSASTAALAGATADGKVRSVAHDYADAKK